jgi:hypothetical protein
MSGDRWKHRKYVPCPNCSGAIMTKEYAERYGQCMACYKPLGKKMAETFGYGGKKW